jgi:hypothetical protein
MTWPWKGLKGVELIGELADGGRLHQSRDPLLSLAPMRQCRLDRGLARGREICDVLALIDVSNPSVEANALGEFSRMVVARLVLDRAFIVDLFP